MLVRKNENITLSKQATEKLNDIGNYLHSDNTKKAYKKDIDLYQRFCSNNDLNELEPGTLIEYVAELSEIRKYSTINRKIAAIRVYLHQNNIDTILLDAKIKTLKKALKNKLKETNPEKQTPALQQNQLFFEFLPKFKTKTNAGYRDYVITLLAYFGAFRISEVLNLTTDDVKETSGGLIITVKSSKNHKEATYKFIPYRDSFCPVLTFKHYLKFTGIKEGYLFPNFKAKENKPVKYLVYKQKFTRLTGLSPHSLRVGFVTDAFEHNASIQAIMKQTGHKSVDMVVHYTKSVDVTINNAVSQL